MVHEAFDRHLTQCSICRTERTQALDGHAPRQLPIPAPPHVEAGGGRKLTWTVAALLVGAAAFGGYYYFSAHNATHANASVLSEHPHATVAVDPRYKDLVENVPINDVKVMASVRPDNRAAIKFALDQFSLGQASQALMVSAQVAGKGNDPGAQMIYAMSLYRTQLMTDAYREMLKSEAMNPRDSFRCWIMLQFALMVGDRDMIEREGKHLADNPEYHVKVSHILDQVRARG